MTPITNVTLRAELCHAEFDSSYFDSSYNGLATIKMTIVRKKRKGEEIIRLDLLVPRDMIAPTVTAMRTFVSRELKDVQGLAGYVGAEE